MAYFTFSEDTGKEAIKWMIRNCSDYGEEPLSEGEAYDLLADFMRTIGYDTLLGIKDPYDEED